MKTYSLEELLHKAASYCSISEHCKSEVIDKLHTWGVEPKQIDIILARLEANDFLNEKRYCIAYVKDKFRFNKWGKIKIGFGLKQKGLPNVLIENTLKIIDDGEYEELLAEILKAKLKTISWKYDYEKVGKLFAFAQNRGFESSVIDRIVKSL